MGNADAPHPSTSATPNAADDAASSTSSQTAVQPQSTTGSGTPGESNAVVGRDSTGHPRAKAAFGWGQLLWETWRWGLLIAVAVVISRFSSNT
jgi:ubiquitin-conjugating enzyme E2 J2